MGERIDTDAVLRAAMLANHLQEKGENIDFEGPLWQQVKEEQRAELGFFKVTGEVGAEVRDDVLLHKFLGKAGHALGWIGGGMITAGYETIAKAFETMHEGEQLNLALKRECAVGACAILCSSALPEGFRAALREQFVGKGNISAGAESVAWTLLGRPDAARLRAAFVANCQDGQRYALDRHITSAADLRVALNQNSEFATRYQHDLAFKLGVDSVVWSNEHGQLPELEHQLPPAPAPATVEVRG